MFVIRKMSKLDTLAREFFTVILVLVSLVTDAYPQSEQGANTTLVPSLKFATPCKTPNDDDGYCINIEECESVFKISTTNENGEFIKDSNCTPSNANPGITMVCCGRYGDYMDKRQSENTEQMEQDPFSIECGKQMTTFPSRIFGGTEADLGEFPWLVRLRHKTKSGLRSYGCAGFLIAAKYVITAAHCIQSDALTVLGPIKQVQLGEHDVKEAIDCKNKSVNIIHEVTVCADPPQIIRTGKAIVHPEYDNNSLSQHHDIAIIPLKAPANITDYVRPICLAEQLSSESEMWLSGWGKTESDDRSRVKLKVAVKRSDLNYCKAKYKTAEVDIDSSQLCAGGEIGKDSCSGDSGGPLMVQSGSNAWTAEGVVSFGLGCGLEYWPGVYTNIPAHYSWIQKTVKRHWRHNLEKAKNCKTKNAKC